jgi:hypothetical protein
MCGFYTGTPTIRFENGAGSNTLPNALGAAFVSKFSSSGVYQWSRILDAALGDEAWGVACDLNNNVYISGRYDGTPTIRFENGAGSNTLPASTGQAAFVSKFDTNGVYQWSRVLDNPGSTTIEHGYGISCDLFGNIHLSLRYEGTPVIKTESNQILKSLPTSTGQTSLYCILNTYGTYIQSRIIDSAGADRGLDVVIDSTNNVYFSGFYTGTPTIRNDSGASLFTLPASAGGSQAAFVTKFTPFFSNLAINEYPPTRLTANTFVVSGQSYGNGTYTLAASSESTAATGPFQAFDKSVSNVYQSAASRYSTTTPFANVVAASTVITNFGTIGGEWIDITLPNSIQLYGYQIQPTATIAAGPGTFFLCGHDGSSFQMVDRRGGYTWISQSSVTFNVNIQTSYNRYRLVVPNLAGNAGNLQIAEIRLFGT